MDAADVYLTYCAIKAHFSKNNYDYHKFAGKTKIKRDSFYKRKDRFFFARLARKYKTKEEIENYLVANYITVKAPIIGTFYRRSSPDKDPFISVGDKIEKGQALCIIEAMKLFNEIESEVSGTIVKVLVDDMSPVEYDQPLFLIDPS